MDPDLRRDDDLGEMTMLRGASAMRMADGRFILSGPVLRAGGLIPGQAAYGSMDRAFFKIASMKPVLASA